MKKPGTSLAKELEKKLLSAKLKPAKPVGLRYDRREFLSCVPGERSEPSYWYSWCNGLLVKQLFDGYKDVLAFCDEGWVRDVLDYQEVKPIRIFDARHEKPISRGRTFDAVVTDSSILLSGNVVKRLESFRQLLREAGRVCVLSANWEYEMAGKGETYQTSFKRYRGDLYLGLLRRTLNPPQEVEYVCLLDPKESRIQELASMEREELRSLSLSDAPEAARAVISAELIKIPQFTKASLEESCNGAGFSSVVVSGAPGILASRVFEWLTGPCIAPFRRGSLAASESVTKSETKLRSSRQLHLLMEQISRNLVLTFPFISSDENPHIVAVCVR